MRCKKKRAVLTNSSEIASLIDGVVVFQFSYRLGDFAIMGSKQKAQALLSDGLSLQDHVAQDNLNSFVNLSSARVCREEFLSHTSGPSIESELLIRMLLVGYCLGLRSNRRLCEVLHLNLTYRKFCGYLRNTLSWLEADLICADHEWPQRAGLSPTWANAHDS